jgi:2-C-methyl-D-erythritol 4-phosphate cytidylyltransferase
VIVALPPGTDAALPDGVARVDGGATRAESVAAALEQVDTDLVVVHDAARPLATPALFNAVIETLRSSPNADGVIAAAPLTDTIKRTGESHEIRGSEDRSELWAAQTPQAFRTQALRDAYAEMGEAAMATDEAMLIERAGGTVLIEPAPVTNMKITTPEDLRVAQLLLANR